MFAVSSLFFVAATSFKNVRIFQVFTLNLAIKVKVVLLNEPTITSLLFEVKINAS